SLNCPIRQFIIILNMGLGKKLKMLINNRGLTQRQFADEIGENITQLNKVLNEERVPSYEMLSKSLTYFKDIDLNWLLKDQYNEDDPIQLEPMKSSTISKDVIDDI